MSKDGFYLMHRGWQDNELFRCDAVSKKDAWLWLIENAAWRDGAKVRGITLKRGQLYVSQRYLAEAWGWSKTSVSRLLKSATELKMICCESGPAWTLITICNYRKYQDQGQERGPEVDQERTADGPQTDRRRTKEEQLNKETKESKKLAFEGKTIRLNKADFESWSKAYSNLDLTAELQALDDYYTAEKISDWFVRCSGALRKRHDAKAAEIKAKMSEPVRMVNLGALVGNRAGKGPATTDDPRLTWQKKASA